MIHTFSYQHKKDTLYFLWDIESGSLHIVDYLAFLVCKEHFGLSLSEKEKTDYISFLMSDKTIALDEILILEGKGLLNSEPKVTNYVKSTSLVKSLCLNICHDCNLRCKYCFAKDGTYNTSKDYMSPEVGIKAVDFLLVNSKSIRNVEIDFFGGEPMLNLQTVKKVISYARSKEKEHNKLFHFTFTTNCTLLSEKSMDFLNEQMVNVVLSLDGRQTTHDKVRLDKYGKGSYDTALKNAKAFKEIRGDKQYYVRGTFTSLNLDFCKDIFALAEEGFDQISIEPVVLPEDHPLAIKKEHLDRIFKEYDFFADKYLESRRLNRWFNFFHFMIDLNNGPCVNKRLSGCGAGTEYLAISPTGEIYPCHQFVGNKEFVIGNVYDGIICQDIRKTFSKNTIFSKSHCENCFAKYFCGGGCVANAYNLTGNLNGEYEIGCMLTKKRLELSLAIWAVEKLSLQ